jgi:hypothetical protein
MKLRLRLGCLAFLLIGLAGAAAAGSSRPADEPPQTVAETSNFARTSRYDDVQAFLETLAAQSPLVHLDAIGTTQEGRSIPLAILADPPVRKPEDVKNRVVVLLFGNIHAGEVCGKEALMMLARDVALNPETAKGLLEKLVICFVPIYNADGNEKMAPDHRPGQVGPEEMGTRANAQNFDLNRDYVKIEAPETRALIRFFNTWDPTIVVDTHTTNGSRHRYTLTYQGPKHPGADAELVRYVRDAMLPAIDEAFEASTGFNAFVYGNFSKQHTQWTTYPAQPRYGEGYLGLRNRIALLSEAYAYAPFEDRVRATYAFCNEILGYAASHADEIRTLVREADRRTIDAGREPDGSSTVSLANEARALSDKATALGYVGRDADGNRVESDEPRDYEVELINDFVSTLDVSRPWAYAFAADHEWLATMLAQHGVAVEVLREDIEVDSEAYVIGRFSRAERAFEGHTMLHGVGASAVMRSTMLPAGTYVVRTAQKLGTLAAVLLEPQSEDGLVAWNFFDAVMEPGSDFPVVRLPRATHLTLRSAKLLEIDRTKDRRLSYDDVHGSGRVNLSGSPISGLSWVDDEHFLQRKGDQTLKVHARTGRYEPHTSASNEALVERLASLPTFDAKSAADIARRHFSRATSTDDAPAGRVFEHEGDLYYAALDGSNAVRLTSSPQKEELPTLSPDGEFVAYVRDNDLWVVDIATATERALTTGCTSKSCTAATGEPIGGARTARRSRISSPILQRCRPSRSWMTIRGLTVSKRSGGHDPANPIRMSRSRSYRGLVASRGVSISRSMTGDRILRRGSAGRSRRANCASACRIACKRGSTCSKCHRPEARRNC